VPSRWNIRSRARGQALHLVPVEHLAPEPAHRTLDRDDSDLRLDAAAGRSIEDRLDVGAGEGRFSRSERHQSQSRERLRRVAGVVVDVARLGHDHAAFVSGERAERELVRERAGGHEHRPLLPQLLRPPVLEALDLATEEVAVLSDLRPLRDVRKQRRVFAWRKPDAVARHSHHAFRRHGGRSIGESLQRRNHPAGRRGRAQGLDEPAPERIPARNFHRRRCAPKNSPTLRL
jgi:hypothetical protein